MPLGNVGSTKANKREIFERKISNRINTGATEKKEKWTLITQVGNQWKNFFASINSCN